MTGVVLTNGVVLTGGIPLPPGVVTATPQSQTTVLVEWTNDSSLPNNATSFLVERSLNEVDWVTVDTVSTLSLTDTGLTAGTQYFYRVTAINAWGQTLGLTVADATTPSPGPPDAPTGLVATAISSASINLTWTDNSDNDDGFHVHYDTVATFDNDPQHIVTGSHASSYTVTGLLPETTYYFRVHAFNSVGDSAFSNTDSDTTPVAGDATFSLTAVPDATVGITSTITSANWTHASASWWPWTLRTFRFERTGNVGLLIVHHSDYGGRLYNGDGLLGFTDGTAAYGVSSPNMSDAVGGYLPVDYDHDGYGDLICYSTNSMSNWVYDDGTQELAAVGAPWNFEGPSAGLHLHKINEVSGRLEFESEWYPQWPQTLTFTRGTWTFNGTSYVEVKDAAAEPTTGIPAGTITEMKSYLDDGSQVSTKRFISFAYIPFDLDLDGSADDLIVTLSGGYGGANRGWFLQSDGAGGYVDRTNEWGLPDSGFPLIVRQKEFGRPLDHWPADASWHDFAGVGRPDLFLANIPGGGDYGHYRWTGSGYTKLTASPLTDRLGLDDSYPKRLYAVDLTNSGRLDLVLSRPRQGYCYIFLNDGAGNFTEYSVGRLLRHWDSDGMVIDDLDIDGLPEVILGGDEGTDSGVTSANNARCLSVWENTTSNPGNYLGLLIRRTGHEATNYFGVASKIEVFVAGQSFSAAALIRRWHARPDGLPLIFGVGSQATIDLRVKFPDDTVSTQTGVTVNQTVTVTEVDQ